MILPHLGMIGLAFWDQLMGAAFEAQLILDKGPLQGPGFAKTHKKTMIFSMFAGGPKHPQTPQKKTLSAPRKSPFRT